MKAYCEANKELRRAYSKAHYEANKEHKIATNKAWREANPERSKAHKKAYYEANKGRVAASNRAWAQANKDKRYAAAAKRRARERNQTPELTQQEKAHIEHLYWMAQDCRAVSGEMYHVDHIKPISKGGLHHPDNLQVMHWKDNLNKGASYE